MAGPGPAPQLSLRSCRCFNWSLCHCLSLSLSFILSFDINVFTVFLLLPLQMFAEVAETHVVWSEVYLDEGSLDKTENEELDAGASTPDLLETVVKSKPDIPVKRKTKSPVVEFDSQVPVATHPGTEEKYNEKMTDDRNLTCVLSRQAPPPRLQPRHSQTRRARSSSLLQWPGCRAWTWGGGGCEGSHTKCPCLSSSQCPTSV